MRLNIGIKDILQCLRYVVALMIYAVAINAATNTNLGLGPWEVFSMGLSKHLPLTFGQCVITVSVIIVIIDIVMKEKIGIGMILDAFLVGTFIDICMALDFVPHFTDSSLAVKILAYLITIPMMSLATYLTMSACQGMGPRDTLVVALGRRVRRIPIGVVMNAMLVAVTLIGWYLGGPVGIGTLISAFGIGATLQFWCAFFHFEPRDVEHKSLADYVRRPNM